MRLIKRKGDEAKQKVCRVEDNKYFMLSGVLSRFYSRFTVHHKCLDFFGNFQFLRWILQYNINSCEKTLLTASIDQYAELPMANTTFTDSYGNIRTRDL